MGKIGIIGHVDHGKTTLASAIAVALATADIKKDTKKTIQEIIEEEKSFKITAPSEIPIWDDFKSGKESRRARRKKERKNNKK